MRKWYAAEALQHPREFVSGMTETAQEDQA